MRAFFLVLLSWFFGYSPISTIPVTEISASSYCLLERDSKEVLEGKDIHRIRSVASISKIMTAVLALESDKIFDIVTIPSEALKQEGSSIYLKEGDKLSLLDLCYGLMLRSGNDAAYTIATYLSPTLDDFVKKMNDKALEIGMKNSTYSNPSGLDIDDSGNLSTAYDMCLLLTYALEIPLFCKITQSESYSCQYSNAWHNKNKLLRQYEWCVGGKTGYTYKAKRTLVTGASKDGLRLALCTLNCGNDFYTHKALYEKYFNTYSYVEFLSKGTNHIYDYIVESKKRYGVMVTKEQYIKGIKLYKFDHEGNLISLTYVTKNNEYIEVKYE